MFRCRHAQTGKLYAIKEFKNKYQTKKKAFECKEIQILLTMDEHTRKTGRSSPYIMRAESIHFENKRVYAVFELMEMSLTQFMRKRSK